VDVSSSGRGQQVFVPTVSVLLIQQCQCVPQHVGEHEYELFSLVRARLP